jgi:hypothetical protein
MFDLSEATAPRWRSRWVGDPVYSLTAAQGLAFVGTTRNEVVILSQRNRSSLAELSRLTLPELAHMLAVSGGRLIVVSSSALRLFDVADPTRPRHLDTLAVPAGMTPTGVSASGETAFALFDPYTHSGPIQLLPLVMSPGTRLIAGPFMPVAGRFPGLLDDVLVIGDFTNTLEIFDARQPLAPRLAARAVAGSSGLTALGPRQIAAAGGGWLQRIDLSDPATPSIDAAAPVPAGYGGHLLRFGRHLWYTPRLHDGWWVYTLPDP